MAPGPSAPIDDRTFADDPSSETSTDDSGEVRAAPQGTLVKRPSHIAPRSDAAARPDITPRPDAAPRPDSAPRPQAARRPLAGNEARKLALAHADTALPPPPRASKLANAPSATPSSLSCPTCGRSLPGDYVVCPKDGTPLGVAKNDEHDPLVGVVLAGTYRLLRVLGKGGMGRLYEAEHARLGRRFAVKVLHEAHADKKDAVRRFEREAQALARIHSDHVLDVVDVLRAPDGRTAIVTPLLEGEDLQRRLDRAGKMPAAEAVALVKMACRGLCAAHAVGVVHRDLKPSNLFLSAGPDGRTTLKILDFGVAKLVDEDEVTRVGVVLGTPAYMAPEQAKGSSTVDARSDVYALGAVLYRMVTGKMPYDATDAAGTLGRLLAGPPPRPRALAREIPLAVEVVIQRAMAREPEDRPPSALELESLLGSIEDAMPQPAVPRRERGRAPENDTLVLPRGAIGRAQEIERQARTARPRALAAAAALVVLSASGGAALLRALATLGAIEGDHGAALAEALAIVGLLTGGGGTALIAARLLRSRWSSAHELDVVLTRVKASVRVAVAIVGSALTVWLGYRALTEPSAAPPDLLLAVGLALAVAGGVLAARRPPQPTA